MLDIEIQSIKNHAESQERIINALNLEVARQWSRIKELEKECDSYKTSYPPANNNTEERIGE